ncbi:hypothetical protein GCM10023194_61650 [Planotetraspora phitsanulokensis]|uniref:SnoaL-like domain-containing protein n=1 Tax=Planotetraspora phitsanulokensis TaxID=575192 RepID=A0A8J3U3B9_9ACTN|nr:nuclear transport factor 2 family protein [Planotetraspora phitsanulokensis]GII37614.1 hypothetical protein Pph01_26170 [Planotetraspora phitsanulokensis]
MHDDHEVTDGLIDAFNAHDFERAAGFFSPRGVYVCPGGIAEGREEIASYFALYIEAFPDVTLTPTSTAVSGDLVVLEWTVTSTHAGAFLLPGGEFAQPTGRHIVIRGCDFRTMDGGLIASQRVYYDQLEMLSQIGVDLISG